MMGLKHQAATARKWRVAIRDIERHLPAYLPPVLFLTDPERVSDPVGVSRKLLPGSGIIYRHFGAKNRIEVARAISQIAISRNLVFLIAADPTLAQTVNAAGVHWPEARLAESRAWRNSFLIQTASAHTGRAVRRARDFGMDAALLSTVFPSNSPSAGAAMGATRLRMAAFAAPLPIYGLGGIGAFNAGRVASATGVAAVEGFS